MFWLILSCLLPADSIHIQDGDKTPEPVKVSAVVGETNAQGEQSLTVTVQIEKGWHIYAHKPGFEGLVATTVTVSSQPKLKDVTIDYPEGELVKDDVLDATYRQYVGTIKINAKLRRDLTQEKATDGPVEVSVKFQCCNDKACLPPQTVKVKAERK